jgi:cysteinyl-tRNA synthetase
MAEAHPLMLYNTLTRRKERFEPLERENVRMYVCGPTVYDWAHIGNARPVIVFDVLFRLLRHIYGADHVTYVRNITDVDDKINKRAAEEGVAIRELTERTAKQFHDDIRALGVLMPEDVNKPNKRTVFFEPRATEHIKEMKALIKALVDKGHAYVAEDHVLFSVPSMPDYGKLSNRSLEEMEAGARVEVAPYKKDPMDFVLWKPSKEGEPSWPSPCGIKKRGRPGWHIECSAMAEKHLGELFDIHGGGIDLVFPHHENEIAQSRCAHGTPVMARFWLHNGFLQVEGEKMSKSLGNFVTIHELYDEGWSGEVLRFNMLRTHYRQPIDWTAKGLQESFDVYYDLLDAAEDFIPTAFDKDFVDALSDDLNTPRAFARLFELRAAAEKGDLEAGGALRKSMMLIGMGVEPRVSGTVIPTFSDGKHALEFFMSLFPRNYPLFRAIRVLRNTEFDDHQNELMTGLSLVRHADRSVRVGDVMRFKERLGAINAAIPARSVARKAKDFKEGDRIRDELAGMGIALKDFKDPKTGEITTTWEVRASGPTEAAR